MEILWTIQDDQDRSSPMKGVAMSELVTLKEPASTRDGLRQQAALMEIPGRGSMNKAQLMEAVTAALTAYRAEYEAARVEADNRRVETVESASLVTTSYGRKLTTHDVGRLESCGLAPGESIVDVAELASVVTIEVSPFMAAVVSAALDPSTRVSGRRGAGLMRTRAGRVDYPARKGGAVRRAKKGRR